MHSHSVALKFLCVLILASPIPACQADGAGAEAVFGVSACAACIKQRCPNESNTCAADAGCASYLGCLSACGVTDVGDVDADCDARCREAAPPSGQARIAALSLCREKGAGTRCTACGKSPPLAPDAHAILTQNCAGKPPIPQSSQERLCFFMNPPPPNPTKDTKYDLCLAAYCCESLATCDSNPNCKGYIKCMKDCVGTCEAPKSDPDCSPKCARDFAAGRYDFEIFAACASYHCTPCKNCALSADSPCSLCITRTCFEQRIQCAKNLDCLQMGDYIRICEKGTSSATCQEQAWTMYPKGQKDFLALKQCQLYFCGFDCSETS